LTRVYLQVLGSELQTSCLANSNDGSNKTLQGNEDAGGKDCLSGLSNTTDAVNIGTDELSQQKQSFSNENQQENGGGSTALEVSFMQFLYAWSYKVLDKIMSVVADLYSFFSTTP